jgi:hypothetical protein
MDAYKDKALLSGLSHKIALTATRQTTVGAMPKVTGGMLPISRPCRGLLHGFQGSSTATTTAPLSLDTLTA